MLRYSLRANDNKFHMLSRQRSSKSRTKPSWLVAVHEKSHEAAAVSVMERMRIEQIRGRSLDAIEQGEARCVSGTAINTMLRLETEILRKIAYLPFGQASGTMPLHRPSKLYEHARV